MPRLGPGERAQIGATVLAAAETVDTRLVEGRLTIFAATHQQYIDAQRVVAAAAAELAAAAAFVRRCDDEQDAGVERLAAALVMDGQPRDNPFRAFRVRSPALLQRLAAVDEAKAIHGLVASVQRMTGPSSALLQAARAADAAACAVEQALAATQQRELTLRTARVTRDAIGQSWNRDLAALKRMAQCAADEGAPHLHATLFGSVRRTARKKGSRRVKRGSAQPSAPTGGSKPLAESD